VVIDDNSMFPVLGCGDVIINTTKFEDVLHVLGVGSYLLSNYCITHQQKDGMLAKLLGSEGHE